MINNEVAHLAKVHYRSVPTVNVQKEYVVLEKFNKKTKYDQSVVVRSSTRISVKPYLCLKRKK